MRITADTNILARAITGDDPVQTKAAQRVLLEAELVALPLPALCELAWVLGSTYRFDRNDVSRAIEGLMLADNVAVDGAAVEAGLNMLAAGGDFADGVIAHMGRWLGAATFVSFDKKAVRLLKAQGQDATEPR